MGFLEKNKFFLVYALLYLLLFGLFYPSYISSSDEHGYLKTAELLTQGKIAGEDIFSSARSNYQNGFFYPIMFLGFSFFLAPFVLFGLGSVFLVNLIVHLFNLFLCSKIFRELKIEQKYLFLYLFFPALVWLSRTLYPHLLTASLFLLAFLFYLRLWQNPIKNFFLTGFFLGFAVFLRGDAIAPVILFTLALLWKHRLKILPYILGGGIWALLIMFLNNLLYGSALTTSYNYPLSVFLFRIFFEFNKFDFLIYIFVFLLIYPLMLLAPYLMRKKLPYLELYALILGGLLLQSTANLFFNGFNLLSFVFVNIRYLSFILPFAIIPFALFFQTFLDKYLKNLKIKNAFVFLVFLCLLSTTAYFSYKHSELLDSRSSVYQILQNQIPSNALVLGSSDDHIYFSPFFSQQKYLRIDYCNDFNPCPDFDFSSVFDSEFYLLDLQYGNREDRENPRQEQTIDKERQVVKDFILEHKDNLELVYSSDSPNNLSIYKYTNDS